MQEFLLILVCFVGGSSGGHGCSMRRGRLGLLLLHLWAEYSRFFGFIVTHCGQSPKHLNCKAVKRCSFLIIQTRSLGHRRAKVEQM